MCECISDDLRLAGKVINNTDASPPSCHSHQSLSSVLSTGRLGVEVHLYSESESPPDMVEIKWICCLLSVVWSIWLGLATRSVPPALSPVFVTQLVSISWHRTRGDISSREGPPGAVYQKVRDPVRAESCSAVNISVDISTSADWQFCKNLQRNCEFR